MITTFVVCCIIWIISETVGNNAKPKATGLISLLMGTPNELAQALPKVPPDAL